MKRSQIVVEFVAMLSIVIVIAISVLIVMFEQPESFFERGEPGWDGLLVEVEDFVSNGTAVGLRVYNSGLDDLMVFGTYIDGVWIGNNTYVIEAGNSSLLVYNYSGNVEAVVLTLTVLDERALVNVSSGRPQDATSISGGLSGVYYGLFDGLIGYYNFDAADTPLQTDSSGVGQHADTVFDGASSVPGRIGSGVAFDGDGDYIDVGTTIDTTYIDAATAQVTVSLWYWTNTTSNSMVWWEGETQLLYYPSIQRYLFRWRNSSLQTSTYIYADAPLSTWHHVIQRYNGTAVALFIDGIFVNTTDFDGGLYVGSDLYLGKDETSNYANGTLDEFMVWNRSLSDDEIQRLYLLQTLS